MDTPNALSATDRITTILDSCADDAKAQLTALRALIDGSDSRDVKAMAVMALAAENTAATLHRYYHLLAYGGRHGLSRTAA